MRTAKDFVFRALYQNRYNQLKLSDEFSLEDVNGRELLGNPQTKAIMQWTGLLDKNKKKIFEGYICNIKRYHDKRYIVAEVIWGCEHSWNFRSYYIAKGQGDHYGTRFVEVCEIEVIGNIYEHPALLGDKNENQTYGRIYPCGVQESQGR